MMYCRQKTSCRVCGRRHHSLLHTFSKKKTEEEKKEAPAISSLHGNVEERQEDGQDITDIATHFASHFTSNRKSSLLATAVVPVRSSSGQTMLLRALIDLGSEASF
ncbi:putative bel12 ag transposon polyprotein, partial [Operophtera brumata]